MLIDSGGICLKLISYPRGAFSSLENENNEFGSYSLAGKGRQPGKARTSSDKRRAPGHSDIYTLRRVLWWPI